MGHSRDWDRSRGKTLVIELVLEATSTLDSSESRRPQVGDVRINYGTATTARTGKPFGTWSELATVVTVEGEHVTRQVSGIFDTPHGQITAMGLDPEEGVRLFAITGGTESFVGASGVVEAGASEEVVITVTVTWPRPIVDGPPAR
ncbi:hypothetical protein QTQ03_05360 [Micromonospora sp. WMMA1363]|uniref:hypothetical protein n=1 Tax=Micromonospora sp. WMMA1363 TaxID=3053985 RepID=UPI00259CD85F|nr:hypothetical protein [Micromonospora sp. WMMA1363]MDM4719051.1 hypothetical protein [Micromonospora sp. WMMA1363]